MNHKAQNNVGEPLQKVVHANGSIRAVIDMSRRVNLVAINAALAAKKAGAQARGFGVVSAELRHFSNWLDQQMAELDQLIAALVVSLAEAAKERRSQNHLLDAQARSADPQHLESTTHRLEQRLVEADEANRQRWRALTERIGQVLRRCNTGTALVRSAKVEAVYGGAFAAGLRQVAEEIEATIGTIQQTLKQLSHDVAEAQS